MQELRFISLRLIRFIISGSFSHLIYTICPMAGCFIVPPLIPFVSLSFQPLQPSFSQKYFSRAIPFVTGKICNLFNDKDFIYTNKFEESIRVVFPVYMYSRVKFVKLSNGECEMNTFVSNSVTTSFMVSLDISSRMALKSL